MDGKSSFIIGTQESAQWNGGTNTTAPTVSYTYLTKRVTVELICSTNGTNLLEAFGENPFNTFKFRLTHRCACWNQCRGKRIQNELIYITQ